jgi:hypothetical protein
VASIYQDAICFLFTLEAFIVTAKPSKLPQPTAPPVESWVFFVLHSTAPASLKSALPGRAERICLWWVSTELNISESDMIRNQLTAFCSQWEQQKRHDQMMRGFEAY